jgi:hypothetical protein
VISAMPRCGGARKPKEILRRTSASWNGCGRSANRAAAIFIAPQGVRLGKRFARALVISTLEGETQHGDAFRLLGFSKLATLRELGHRLGVVGELR